MKAKTFTSVDVQKIAKLANLPLSEEQSNALTDQVEVTLEYVSKLQAFNTDNVLETSQVTGLENVFRDDEIDVTRMLTQEEALKNSKRTHNGYFVVDAVFEEK